MNLLEIKNLKKHYISKTGIIKKKAKVVKAVDDISFYIKKGETLGVIGESGSGKSTLGRSIIKLFDVDEGQIIFDGVDIANKKEKDLKDFRKKVQTIFQDPYSSLNPNMTIKQIIREPLDLHSDLSTKQKDEIVYEMLEKVGLNKSHASRYPHEFSGGQRQRVGIARALSVKPEFIFCDEPISALDVSIQAQIVNLLEDLKNEYGITYLFVAHNLSMVRHISDRVCVMYRGKIVEIGTSEDIYMNPKHPYTKLLIGEGHESNIIDEDNDTYSGCRFKNRCSEKTELCDLEQPKAVELSKEHIVYCNMIKR